MGTKRILGNDRIIMFLCKSARRYWNFYSESRKQTEKDSHCNMCGHKVKEVEVDHNPPLGPRPRNIEQFGDWLNRLIYGPVQGLCIPHHRAKTAEERKKRSKKCKSNENV